MENNNNNETQLDKGLISISAVIGAFLKSWAAVATLIVGAFIFGGQLSELRSGLAQANSRLDKGEQGIDSRIRDYQELQRVTNGRISSLESTVTGFDKKLDLILRIKGR